MNGSVIPVNGTELVKTAMFIIAWNATPPVTPTASKRPNWSGAYQATRRPR